ncbi:transport and Golgi organization protein 1 homolog isoform X1 [Cavia porcellus]|uniref:transport and Golgi organization protein 1 homolog isoform X1 n=1 Tax=Cavia porcellus TaxID=10141 RepID=UPI002FE30CA7
MEMTEKLAMRQEEPDILKQMLDRPGVQNALRRDPGPGPVAYSDSRGSSLAKGMDDGKVSMAAKGPPAYPGPPFLGRPMPRPVVYGPPPQPRLCGTFRPRPMPPPRPLTFVSCMGPPLGLREYTPGILPRRCDLPLHPREFLLGPVLFRPWPAHSCSSNATTTRQAPGQPLLSEPKEAPASPQSSREPAHALRQSA